MSTGYIICNWKQAGAYTRFDSINGKVYKNQKTAERIAENIEHMRYVVREVLL